MVAEWDPRRRIAPGVGFDAGAAADQERPRRACFGLPEFNVEVVAPDVGGGFGTKIMLFYPEEILVP